MYRLLNPADFPRGLVADDCLIERERHLRLRLGGGYAPGHEFSEFLGEQGRILKRGRPAPLRLLY